MKSGIYIIVNLINNKIYVGSAVNLEVRWGLHKTTLKSQTHKNKHLQLAWNKYGIKNFKFYVLEYVERSMLIQREQFWINKTKCYNRNIGYNVCPTAGNSLGFKHSEESLIKISKNHIGMKGKHWSEEAKHHRNKIKWPCIDGHLCKCNNCKEKRNLRARENYNLRVNGNCL